MALKYQIHDYRVEPSDASKTAVTFDVTNDLNEKRFITTGRVTTGDKTVEAIIKEAQTSQQAGIDEWYANFATIGKTWNPDTETLE